jgi:hypothetical protein
MRRLKRIFLVMFLVAATSVPIVFGQNSPPGASGLAGNDLVPTEQNGVWGYANPEGKVVIKPQFTAAGRFSDGLALVWTGGVPVTDSIVKSFVKMGYIDETGRWVIHSRFEYYFFDDFSQGLVPFRQQFSKWGYMDTTGKIAIRPRFDWAGGFSDHFAAVLLDGKCAHIDRTGKITDQAQTVLPRHRSVQDRNGTYLFRPTRLPCS